VDRHDLDGRDRPSPATFSALLSVSCPSASHCVAVGASSPTVSGAVSSWPGLERQHLDGGNRRTLIPVTG
jgi:hypothetical protein